METKTYSKFWVRASGIALIVAVVGSWVWMVATPAPRVKPPVDRAIAIDKSPAAQRERKALIDAMIEKGLVRAVSPPRDGEVRLVLRAPFYVLDDETRRRHVEVVYSYYFDGSSLNDTVILRDARHGNEIGQYNPYRGGLKMYR